MSIELTEYRGRIDRLARALRADGLDGAMLTAESNIDYFSGYRHHAPWTVFARPFVIVVNADGRAAMIAHNFLKTEMDRRAVIADIRGYARSGNAPVDLIAEAVRDLGLATGRVGTEFGYEQRLGIAHGDLESLRQALPQLQLHDIAAILWRMRSVKSPAEIELLKKSAAITQRAFVASFESARPGMTEREIAVIASKAMIDGGADRPGFVITAAGVENYRHLSGRPGDRQLQKGDMLWIDMGAVYQGYWSDFCRAATVGPPTRAQRDGQNAILQVNQACIDAVKPYEPVARVAEAAQHALARMGSDIKLGDNRIGHGIGLMGTEPPHVALYEQTPMEPGLVFTIEPRILSNDGIFNCEELLLVTETGAEVLTEAPRELAIIE